MTEQKSNIEILNEIRNSRNEQLKDLGRNNIFVTKVEALGIGTNTNKRFFRLIEEKEVLNPKTEEPIIDEETGEVKKEIWEWFYEYENAPKIIAVRNPNTKEFDEDGIMPLGLSLDEQPLWDSEREDIVKCLEEREKELKAIAKELGISEKEINSLSEIELAQKVDEKQRDNEDEKQEEKENEPKQFSEEEMKKVGMTGMNEVNLNVRVDEKDTELGDVLNMKEYSKIMVVHSYKLAELTDSDGKQGKNRINKFSVIAQKPDGTYETIPESKLTPRTKDNKKFLEMNNEDDVKLKNEDCIWDVPGTKYSLAINQDDSHGRVETYIGEETEDQGKYKGNMAIRLQNKYDGTEIAPVETRELFNANKGIRQAENSIKEAETHSNDRCENISVKEADGREDTGHTHFNPNLDEQQKAIEEIIEKGKVSENEAKRLFAKHLENRGNQLEGKKQIYDAKENAIREIEGAYKGEREPRNRN